VTGCLPNSPVSDRKITVYKICHVSYNIKTCIYLYINISVRVKQSRYIPEQAQRVDKGIALPFRDLGARRGCAVSITPRPLYSQERPGTHCTGGWVGPRADLDVNEKSRPHRDAIPGSSSP
jgi:hypothetical protein